MLIFFARSAPRLWPNDQTLLVKHLQFANEAKCFTVRPHHKTLLVIHLSKVFLKFFIAERALLAKNCFVTWPNGQTLLVKQISNV